MGSFENLKGGDPKSSVHTFKMLVFQVLCSLKPGEASMAYSLRTDMKCCIKHQVKERELDIPISSDDQFKEVISVNTKTKQNTHLSESQPGIHCFIKCHIWLSKHKSTNKAVLSTRVSERIILGTEPKNTILTLVGTLFMI